MPISLISPGSILFNDNTIQTTSATGPAYKAVQDSVSGFAINELTAYKLPINTDLSGSRSYDSGNYDITNRRFTPNKAGYYYVSGSVRFNPGPAHSQQFSIGLGLYRNGSEYLRVKEVVGINNNTYQLYGSVVVPMNGTTDFIEWYAGWDSFGFDQSAQFTFESFGVTGNSTAFFVRPL